MSNVEKLDVPDRPLEISLMDAINRVIEDIATDKMTLPEIMGVIEMVKLDLYSEIRESMNYE